MIICIIYIYIYYILGSFYTLYFSYNIYISLHPPVLTRSCCAWLICGNATIVWTTIKVQNHKKNLIILSKYDILFLLKLFLHCFRETIFKIAYCYRRLFDTFHSHAVYNGSTYILSGTLYGSVHWIRAHKGFQPHGTSISRSRLLYVDRHFPSDGILYDNNRLDFILPLCFFLSKTRLGVLW